MKRLFLLLFACTLFSCINLSAKDKENVLRYDVAPMESAAAEGCYIFHVYVYNKSIPKEDEIRKAAVHAVIFRGVNNYRPLAKGITAEQEHADYFKSFFNGPCLSFANVVEGTYTRTKVKKSGYKVGCVVQVMKDQLRKELEQAGVIRSLTSGF